MVICLKKEAYIKELNIKGFKNIQIVKEPADITAEKNDEKVFFEIKKTSTIKEYFGAATLTEWRSAYKNPKNYFFVICQENNDKFHFTEYSPEEFEKFSTIPPFKIFFNIPLNNGEKMFSVRKNKTAIQLTKERLIELDKVFNKFKND